MSVMKKVVFICVCVATVISLCSICFNRASSLEGLAKANVEALASIPDNPTCMEGGPESIGCELNITLETESGETYTYGCQISCPAGTYSCCNLLECTCIRY